MCVIHEMRIDLCRLLHICRGFMENVETSYWVFMYIFTFVRFNVTFRNVLWKGVLGALIFLQLRKIENNSIL